MKCKCGAEMGLCDGDEMYSWCSNCGSLDYDGDGGTDPAILGMVRELIEAKSSIAVYCIIDRIKSRLEGGA